MAKYRLKKSVWKVLIIILVIIVGISIINNTISTSKYKKTNEYKLLQKGYTKDEVELIISTLSKDTVNTLLEKKKDETTLSLIKTKGFSEKNYDRYIKYLTKKYNLSLEKVVLLVNLNRDYEYYSLDLNTNVDDKELMLVNKYYKLDKSYVPDNLVKISVKYCWGNNHQIKDEVYKAFIKMWEDANSIGHYLMINQGYRSYEKQEEIYNNVRVKKGIEYADDKSTRAGYSDYQTGLSLDIFELHHSSAKTFKETDVYLWLKDNSYKYGFIIRYPENTKDITGFDEEPYHFRYVGEKAAKVIYDNNITLEEYLLNYR